MAHVTYMAAMNAARKQFGKDWKESATCEKVDGQWYVQVIQKEEPTPAIPALPAALTAPVIEEPAPATPILPAFLMAPVTALEEVPAEILEADAEAEELDMEQNPEDYVDLQAAADAQANAAAVNDVSPLRPRISTTDKPTKKVWAIADSMPGKKRKEVIEACVAAGIAYGTARTQYQHWFKCVADQKVAPLAVIGADGAITIINQGDAGK